MERLTARKLINDLAGKSSLTTAFFNEQWMIDNALDVAAARLQTQRAREAAAAQTEEEASDTDEESWEGRYGQ